MKSPGGDFIFSQEVFENTKYKSRHDQNQIIWQTLIFSQNTDRSGILHDSPAPIAPGLAKYTEFGGSQALAWRGKLVEPEPMASNDRSQAAYSVGIGAEELHATYRANFQSVIGCDD